jgi:hypothetical protein
MLENTGICPNILYMTREIPLLKVCYCNLMFLITLLCCRTVGLCCDITEACKKWCTECLSSGTWRCVAGRVFPTFRNIAMTSYSWSGSSSKRPQRHGVPSQQTLILAATLLWEPQISSRVQPNMDLNLVQVSTFGMFYIKKVFMDLNYASNQLISASETGNFSTA